MCLSIFITKFFRVPSYVARNKKTVVCRQKSNIICGILSWMQSKNPYLSNSYVTKTILHINIIYMSKQHCMFYMFNIMHYVHEEQS